MAQFDIFTISNQKYLFLAVQHDILSPISTTVVVPLRPQKDVPKSVNRLNPILTIAGEQWVFVPTALAAVRNSELIPTGLSLASERDAILAAMDLLFFGI